MHRIDHPTRQIDGNGPGKDGFTGGDPVTQVAATTLTPDWANAVQEEIANAIALGNLTLDKAQNNQLAQVIAALTAADPETPPEQRPVIDRVSYLYLPDFRGIWQPTQSGNGWWLNPSFEALALSASAKLRAAVPIPSGSTVSFVEANVTGDTGMKLHLFRETYSNTPGASASAGARVTDTSTTASEILSCTASATQDKSTSRLVIELEAAPTTTGFIGYGIFKWVRLGWRSYATLPD
jgi:hypothetical protein